MKMSGCPLNKVIDQALKINWTRDVFDRFLAAEVMAAGGWFETADAAVRENFEPAIW